MVFEYLANLLKGSKSTIVENIEQEEAHKIYENAVSSLENMFRNPIIGLDTRQDVDRLAKIVKVYEDKYPLCRTDDKVFYLKNGNNRFTA